MITRTIQNPSNTPFRFQRTDDGYFNSTALLNEWNKENPNEVKLMANFLKLKTTKEYNNFLIEKYDLKKSIFATTKGTWMHPNMFIDFAMWLSLEFKDMVINWVRDGLIKSRNDAGDYYNLLCSNIMIRHIDFYGCKPNPMIYINEAKFLKVVAGIDDRNIATESQLEVLNVLQKLDSKLIIDGIGKESRYSQLKYLASAL